ncbi:MAG TPA: tetratricopeptide repeat protein [Bacteroidia bacterium]|jgi:serine phosphatase RsbU (regulator of sigma subunit)/Tfp pilus assembly protein PilF|nr:tetratricopeptide repeat protein [Bacteroidia bacterium]
MRKLIIILIFIPIFSKAKPSLHDTDKVKQLNKECIPLFGSGDYAKIKTLSKEALALSEKNSFARGRVESIRWYGLALERTGDPDSAIYFYRIGIQIAHENGLKRIEAQCWHNIGFAAYLHSQFDVAVEGYINAIRIREQIKDTISLGWSENNLGLIYWRQKSRNDALKHFLNANDLFVLKDFKEGIATSGNNIGLIYEEQGDPDAALTYYKTAYKVNCEIDNKSGIALTLNNIGGIFNIKHKNDSAEIYFLRSLKINKEINNLEGLELNYRNLGDVNKIKGDYKNALRYIDTSINVSTKSKSPQGLIASYQSLSGVYEAQGDYKKALEAQREYAKLNDSLNFGDKLASMEAKYGKEKNEKEISTLKHKSEITDLELKRKQWMIYSGIAGGVSLLIIIGFVVRVNLQRRKTNSALEQKNVEISKQKEIVEIKQKEIVSSIYYASRIQNALLTSENYFKTRLGDFFLLYKPKDIVSGDFYWALEHKDIFYLIVADCTGHGVPGAFMSLLNISVLNELIIERGILQPDIILNETRKEIIRSLNPEGGDVSKDGMDCVLCAINLKTNKMTYAGANNSFYLLRNNEIIISETDKMPVGLTHNQRPFTLHEIELKKNDQLYLVTDGYADQFGGTKGKKFKYKQLQQLILNNADLPMTNQKDLLDVEIEKWRGELEQVDDICIVGIKI